MQALVPLAKPDLSKIPKKLSAALTRSDRLALLAYAQSRTLSETGHKWAELRGAPAYKDSHVAHVVAYNKINQIRKMFEDSGHPEAFWEALGLGANRLARALSEGMDATVVKPMMGRQSRVIEYETGGETKKRVVDEDVLVEAGPYVDHLTRVKAAEMAAKLRGDIKRSESMTIQAGIQGEGFQFVFMVDQK